MFVFRSYCTEYMHTYVAHHTENGEISAFQMGVGIKMRKGDKTKPLQNDYRRRGKGRRKTRHRELLWVDVRRL